MKEDALQQYTEMEEEENETALRYSRKRKSITPDDRKTFLSIRFAQQNDLEELPRTFGFLFLKISKICT